MKKTIIAIAFAALAAPALAQPIVNTNPKYDVKVQYRLADKSYGNVSEVSGEYNTAKASTAPFDELTIAPGKSVNVPGKTIKVITMVPGPDTSFLDKLAWIG